MSSIIKDISSRGITVFIILVICGVAIPFLLKTGPAYTGPALLGAIISVPFLLLIIHDYRNGIFILFVFGSFMFTIDRYLRVGIPYGIVFDLIIVLAFIIMVIKMKGRETFQWHFGSIITVSYLIFYAYFTLQIVNPNAMGIAGWLASARFYIYFLLFYIFIHFFQNTSNIKKFVYLWIGMAVLTGLYGLFQEVFGLRKFEMDWVLESDTRYGLYFILGHMRKFSFLSDPSSFGLYMAFSSSACLILAFGPFSLKKRVLLLGSSAAMIVSMSFAGTRTAFAMVMVSIVFFILLNLRNRKIIIASAVLVMAFLGIMYGPFYSGPVVRMRSTFNISNDDSMGVRDYKRIKFQQYIRQNPMGGGLSTAGNNGLRHSRGHPLSGKFEPDSGYLRTGMEMGSIGLLISLFLNCSVMIVGIFNHFKIKDPLLKIINVAFLAPFVGLSVAHFAQDALFTKPINVLTLGTYALMIIIVSVDKKKSKRQ